MRRAEDPGAAALRQRREPLQAAAIAAKTATWAGSIGVPSASAAPHSAISASTQKGPDNSRSSVDTTLNSAQAACIRSRVPSEWRRFQNHDSAATASG